jgi:hypothetical protein
MKKKKYKIAALKIWPFPIIYFTFVYWNRGDHLHNFTFMFYSWPKSWLDDQTSFLFIFEMYVNQIDAALLIHTN